MAIRGGGFFFPAIHSWPLGQSSEQSFQTASKWLALSEVERRRLSYIWVVVMSLMMSTPASSRNVSVVARMECGV